MADSGPMINRCFRHQHPEAYGRPEVPYEWTSPNTFTVFNVGGLPAERETREYYPLD